MRRNNRALYEKIMRNVSREVKKVLNESEENSNDITNEFSNELENVFSNYSITVEELIEKAGEAIDNVNPKLSGYYYLPYLLLAGYGSIYWGRYEAANPKSVEWITSDMVDEFENILARDYSDYTVQTIMNKLANF